MFLKQFILIQQDSSKNACFDAVKCSFHLSVWNTKPTKEQF